MHALWFLCFVFRALHVKSEAETNIKPASIKPINNENPFEDRPPTKPGQYEYPVIFEPIQNIKLSRLTYQVTTIIDLTPYFEFFTNYNIHLVNFLRSLKDQSRVSFLAKHHPGFKAKYDPRGNILNEWTDIDCRDRTRCTDSSLSKSERERCRRQVLQFSMTQNQYYQISNATEYLQQTYEALVTRFLGIIDYLDDTLQDLSKGSKGGGFDRKKRDTRKERSSHMTITEKQQIASMIEVLEEANKLLHSNETNLQETGDQFVPSHVEVRRDGIQFDSFEGELVKHNRTREKRSIFALMLGLGWGVYANHAQIKKLKQNIRILQNQNILQDRKIDVLAKYMNLIMDKTREHDGRLYDLEVDMVRIQDTLQELGYDFQYQFLMDHILRNAQTALQRLNIGLVAIRYDIDKVQEYLRAMATHRCSPVLISPPSLKNLLRKIEDCIKSNPRLCLPYDASTDIWRFYDILRITPVVLDKMLVIMLTIPLTDQSLVMNVYRAHSLPIANPEYKMIARYDLEGKYLAISNTGMYAALPEEDNINMCMASDLGLCNLNQALYPTETLDWCIYALFKQNEAKIEEHCKYRFSTTDKNYAETLESFVWAIAAIQTQKLQVRCLKETHVVNIRPPIEVVYIGNGCEGYSPHMYIPARMTMTSKFNLEERGVFFLGYNAKYKEDFLIAIWMKVSFNMTSKEEARKKVKTWPELHPMTEQVLHQKIKLIDTEDYPWDLPTKPFLIALIIGTVVLVALLVVGCGQMWKHKGTLDLVRNMSKEAGQLVDKENPLSFFKKFHPPIHQANEQNIEKITADILGASCSASVNEMKPLCAKATSPLTPLATLQYEQEIVPMQTDTSHTANSHPGRLSPTRGQIKEVLKDILDDSKTTQKYLHYVDRKGKDQQDV